MYYDEWKKVKVGAKLRKLEDNSIWEVSKKIDKNHYDLIRVPNKKGVHNKCTISDKSTGWSTVLNSYEFKKVIEITEVIYADSEDEARKHLKHLEDYECDELEDIDDSSEFELVSKNEIV